MSLTLHIEPLTNAHNRTGFDYGNEALNQFLQKTARQHTDKGLSKTFVLIDESNSAEIITYMTW